jgi:ribose transport system permease protein
VYVLIALVIFFCIALPNTFARFETVQTMLATQAVAGMLALAVIFPLVVGEFDLSVGLIAGFTAVMAAELNGPSGWATGPTIALCLLLGPAIGLINGLLVTRLRIASFIATLAMATILQGVTIALATQNIFANYNSEFVSWGEKMLFGQIPIPALYLLVVAILVWFLIDITAWGRYLRVVGANARSAVLVGLPVARLRVAAFVMAGFVAGMAGILSTMTVGSASQGIGAPLALPAYAAAFVGATAIYPGRFNVLGTMVAVFLLAVGITGIQLMGAPDWAEQVFDGAALIIAVAIPARQRRTPAA